ncbi:hypothetical protein [Streptomyces tauricus]|nr:hypothetical protein [Streptomyces tauricus]
MRKRDSAAPEVRAAAAGISGPMTLTTTDTDRLRTDGVTPARRTSARLGT